MSPPILQQDTPSFVASHVQPNDANAAVRQTQQVLDEDMNNQVVEPSRMPHAAEDIQLERTKPHEPERTISSAYWSAALFIFLSHMWLCGYAYYFVVNGWRISWITVLAAVFSAWTQLLGITAGYHRLWSHKAYRAHASLRVLLAILGNCSFQGSAKWWAMRHRLHHRFTDTEYDPYDATRGLFYSHIGWLFTKPRYFDKLHRISSKDMDDDWVINAQKKYLLYGYVIFGLLVPGLIGRYLLPERSFWTGAMWLGVVARFISWHCIWTINSLSHWKGYKEFSRQSSAVYVAIVNFIQNGEGHHSYHHCFPTDFRHGHRWADWDPTKWCILLWYYMGLAYDLKTTSDNQIRQQQMIVLKEEQREKEKGVLWGPQDNELPSYTQEEFDEECRKYRSKKILLRLDGYILDVTRFTQHPGGVHMLQAFHGRDIGEAFRGGFNLHTQAAHTLSTMYRVGRVVTMRD